ncbi:MAG: nitrate reductase molybdenum cofactor assembly chaperone [Streptomycetaceae bacterium]|nr:nitrate reductase molybdenum cofactor assembly chaperone [Streptomycetaceae bacterium]
MRYGYAVVHQAAAHCLGYPDAAIHTATPLVRSSLETASGPAAGALLAFLDHVAATGPGDSAEHYVRVFDFDRNSLHLSWWTDGDTRRRGQALVRFVEVYRAEGLEFAGGELPDFLPAVLEFTAQTGQTALLHEHRPALELLRFSLADAESPYARVLEAVCATLPGPSPRDRAAARELARSGPPREDVGLEPYGHLAQLPLLSGSGDHR